jgi:hypothetical protein
MAALLNAERDPITTQIAPAGIVRDRSATAGRSDAE